MLENTTKHIYFNIMYRLQIKEKIQVALANQCITLQKLKY